MTDEAGVAAVVGAAEDERPIHQFLGAFAAGEDLLRSFVLLQKSGGRYAVDTQREVHDPVEVDPFPVRRPTNAQRTTAVRERMAQDVRLAAVE